MSHLFQKISRILLFLLVSWELVIQAEEVSLPQQGQEKAIQKLNQAYQLINKKEWDSAILLLKEIADNKNNVQVYASYYLGMALYKKNLLDESLREFEKLHTLSPNIKLLADSSNFMGQIYLDQKKYAKAQAHFKKLEKKTRRTEVYPEVIAHLAESLLGLKKQSAACRWIVKLYSQYPTFDWVKMTDSGTHCSKSHSDFKKRLRHFVLAGESQKAEQEMISMIAKVKETDKFQAHLIESQFYLQTGDVQNALTLLKPYFPEKKTHYEFLNMMGMAAARAGEYSLAANALTLAAKMGTRKKKMKTFFQLAFLSYQFQDYDGASRKFKEFIKDYPKSSLVQDARWQLAWIKYLKMDYEGAYKDFIQLQTRKGRNDRLIYWTAMSELKMNKIESARKRFELLSKDSLMGYYSIAAQMRLQILPRSLSPSTSTPAPPILGEISPARIRAIIRYSPTQVLLPVLDTELFSDNYESEESIQAVSLSDKDDADAENSTDAADVSEAEVATDVAEADDAAISAEEKESLDLSKESQLFSNKSWMERFQRSHDLISIGLNEWAIWDLYDIERKTLNSEYLRILMREYMRMDQFQRSSSIGQNYFGRQRAQSGMEGARDLWEVAYPKAYSEAVDKYSKKFAVTSELIWGIMRAESNYKKNAISPVGALGLMQVMPYTATRVAGLLGKESLNLQDLYEPDVNIKIGTRYLKRLMEEFQSMIPLVAAGYNAGPHRVKNWLTTFGNLDTDEFIEHIPFLETRNYVKKVMSNSYIYAKLYGAGVKNIFPYLATSVPITMSGGFHYKENWDDL